MTDIRFSHGFTQTLYHVTTANRPNLIHDLFTSQYSFELKSHPQILWNKSSLFGKSLLLEHTTKDDVFNKCYKD